MSRRADSQPLPRVLVITDQDAPDPIAPIQRALRPDDVRRAAVLIQIRLKTSPPATREAAARALLPLGAPMVINGDVGLVRRLGAAVGLHLPSQAPFPDAPRPSLVGRSCHDLRELRAAIAEGADYATLGPVRAVPGKAPPLGIDGLGALIHRASEEGSERALPVFALGGVRPEDGPALRDAGAYGLALMRPISRSPEPARVLQRALDAVHSGDG